jgi:L-aspartate oxidase
MIEADYLVIGSGIAGLSFALRASALGKVVVITKKEISESSTKFAQGGVAVVWSKGDSFEEHIKDTLEAGQGLSRKKVVESVVREGPDRIKELIGLGVNFTVSKKNKHNDYELGLEAAHSHRRILHAGDTTGQEIERVLVERARENRNIKIFENHLAVDLITTGKIKRNFQGDKERCWGAYVLDSKKNTIETFVAPVVVLACGGAGKVYRYTSNPDVATGDGMAMAYRAGATLANMEFVQFHPTCLFHPQAKFFLISEALRGEGGKLVLKNGRSFMHKYDPLKELATRDVVARAIDSELKASGDDFVYLDITHRPKKFLQARFPNIYEKCLEYGIDISRDPIPVVPAAHYFCGGVLTDINGETSIKNLFAIGETACTGLHGANRLASNSLLEALIFAQHAFEKSRSFLNGGRPLDLPSIPEWDYGKARDSDESVVVSQNWEEIRLFMWNYVGIVRSDKRLKRAEDRIKLLCNEISQYYWDFIVTGDLVELRNISVVAQLVIESAQRRKESRGLHYNKDYPRRSASPRETLINRFRGIN